MDIWSIAIFSALVMLSAVGLMAWHVRAWQEAQRKETEAEELDFRRRQFRRRMQTSAMLGMLGAAVVVGRLLGQLHPFPLAIVIYWGLVLLVLIWISLLAIVDVWATKFHFGKQRERILLEQTKLRAQLRQQKSARCNGKSLRNDSAAEN